MQIRTTLAGVALAAAAIAGVAACGSDTSSSGSAPSGSIAGSSSVADSASAAPATQPAAPSDLAPARAQTILRTVVDPATTPADAAALVDSTDPTVGQKLNEFAKGASAGGYTPDVFTVTKLAAIGPDKAAASVAVASPHTPAPVTVTYNYAKVGGTWKLASDAVTALLAMAGGPH